MKENDIFLSHSPFIVDHRAKTEEVKQHGGVAKRLFNNHCFQVTSLKSSGKQEMACLEVEAI